MAACQQIPSISVYHQLLMIQILSLKFQVTKVKEGMTKVNMPRRLLESFQQLRCTARMSFVTLIQTEP